MNESLITAQHSVQGRFVKEGMGGSRKGSTGLVQQQAGKVQKCKIA